MNKKKAIIPNDPKPVNSYDQAEALEGLMEKSNENDKLMHSVIESDSEEIDDGKLVNDAVNNNVSSFTPSTMFQNMINNFKSARQVYGDTFLRKLTGYDPDYIDKNKKIPEFQKELENKLKENIERLQEKGIVDKDYIVTEKALTLGALVMYVQELDHLVSLGYMGEKVNKKHNIYGGRDDVKDFKKSDNYRDIALKKSIKTAIRRGHSKLEINDLKSFDKVSKGEVNIVYAIDASGSMKGKKIEAAKKAGVALAFKAIEAKDKVGLIVFGDEVHKAVEPCYDFGKLLKEMSRIKTTAETNMAETISRSIELFSNSDVTKHLIFLTDAMPTVGSDPIAKTLEAVGMARNSGITISLIGISLDKQGKELAEQITEIGQGRLYVVKNLDDVDKIVLEDYYNFY